jgi:hypothetical protein
MQMLTKKYDMIHRAYNFFCAMISFFFNATSLWLYFMIIKRLCLYYNQNAVPEVVHFNSEVISDPFFVWSTLEANQFIERGNCNILSNEV